MCKNWGRVLVFCNCQRSMRDFTKYSYSLPNKYVIYNIIGSNDLTDALTSLHFSPQTSDESVFVKYMGDTVDISLPFSFYIQILHRHMIQPSTINCRGCPIQKNWWQLKVPECINGFRSTIGTILMIRFIKEKKLYQTYNECIPYF